MSIICGTDFSEMAAQAATAAACIAARLGEPLQLVHALDLWPEELSEQPGHPLLLSAESRLAREAERLGAMGATVQARAVAGPPEAVLKGLAHELSAKLVVVGARGRHNSSRGLGSRADRTAQESHVPVLAVRDAAPFVGWAKEGRLLRIVLGVDATASAENAGRWLDELCRLGSCEVILAHLYWPPEAYNRLGVEGDRSFVEADPEIVKTLTRQFSERLDPSLHAKVRSYRIEPHLGRVGDGLAALAAEMHADLVVVGVHRQDFLARLWEGSVARQALRAASLSVLCVPAPAVARATETPKLKTVLAATDFSELGNGAIPLAYAAVAPGGTVHLIHVVKAGKPHIDPYDIFHPISDATTVEAESGASARLSRLVPTDISEKHVTTRVHALEGTDPATAICQAAERLGVDLICVGTRGRTGLARAALGSVASSVLAKTGRPVLLSKNLKP